MSDAALPLRRQLLSPASRAMVLVQSAAVGQGTTSVDADILETGDDLLVTKYRGTYQVSVTTRNSPVPISASLDPVDR